MRKINYFYMNSAEVLDRAFYIYKKSFLQQLLFSIVVTIISGMIVGALAVAGGVSVFAGVLAGISLENPIAIFAIVSVALIVGLTLYIFISSFKSCGNIVLSRQAFYEQKPDIGVALKVSFSSFLRIATTLLAQVIITIPFIILLVGILIVGGLFLDMSFSIYYFQANFESFTGITVAFLIIYSIIVFVVLSFLLTALYLSVPVAIFEKKHFFKAVKKGYELVKTDFFKTFGVLLIFTIVLNLVVLSIAALIFIVLTLVLNISNFSSLEIEQLSLFLSMFQVSLQLVLNVLNVIISPFDGILSTIIYFNQKIKHEGTDIEIEVNRLERQAEIDSIKIRAELEAIKREQQKGQE